MIFLISLGAFCATLIGGLFALHLKDRLHLVLGFSAGAILAVAFFDLLPEAIFLADLNDAVTKCLAYPASLKNCFAETEIGLNVFRNDQVVFARRKHNSPKISVGCSGNSR